MKRKIVAIMALVIIATVVISANFVGGGYLQANQTNDEVKIDSYRDEVEIEYEVITGISESNPDWQNCIIVNITHGIDFNEIIHIDATMYNESLDLGFTPNAGGPHPNGGEFDYGQFTVYFDETNIYIWSPCPVLWGSHYTIVVSYIDDD